MSAFTIGEEVTGIPAPPLPKLVANNPLLSGYVTSLSLFAMQEFICFSIPISVREGNKIVGMKRGRVTELSVPLAFKMVVDTLFLLGYVVS